ALALGSVMVGLLRSNTRLSRVCGAGAKFDAVGAGIATRPGKSGFPAVDRPPAEAELRVVSGRISAARGRS
ncbi:MAG TPA: hypothetical protein VK827_02485, partial [Lysobacter sp.]|nr:hypothetical protein [Lysobacter sp.]